MRRRTSYKRNTEVPQGEGRPFKMGQKDFDFACSRCGYKRSFDSLHLLMVHIKDEHKSYFKGLDSWFQEMAMEHHERWELWRKREAQPRKQQEFRPARVF